MKNKLLLLVGIIVFSLLFAAVCWIFIPGEAKVRQIKETNKNISISIKYPITQIPSIDAIFSQMAQKEITDFKASIPEVSPNPDWKYDLEIDYVEYLRGDIKSFVFTVFSFTGGAHPMTRTLTKTFNMKTGEQLNLNSFFNDDPTYPLRLYPLIVKDLKTRQIADDQWIEEGTHDLSKFAVTDTEIILFYDPYEVAPYSAGPQEVRIPFKNL
ncbi:MAG: DUF3298 and DUF4163 domain-containing protein [Candidatus Saganbacteria bacterium]|nr:DUF3298 and DUF4163 domain-containing protein [Candidatus Saganbacteria bacterium]